MRARFICMRFGWTGLAALAVLVCSVGCSAKETALVSLAVTPASVAAGYVRQLSATGSYSDNSSRDLSGLVSWSSMDGEVATVNAAGLARGVKPGKVTMRASLGAVSGEGTLSVDDPPVTNSSVYAIAAGTDGVTYLGGSFSQIGPATGGLVRIGADSGQRSAQFPKVAGTVYALTPDGSGGWFVGGDFTHVGGVARRNLAHIQADGAVDGNWAPSANGVVYALALSDGIVYAGGSFTTIDSQPRSYLAAIDGTSGSPIGWAPKANSPVYALALSDGTVYAGGWFTTIDSQPRGHLAAIDGTSGSLIGEDLKADSIVYTLAVADGIVYAGGAFTRLGDQTRNRLAAIDASAGAVTSWSCEVDPDGLSSWVSALLVSGPLLYVGGNFHIIGGTQRTRLAAVDRSSGAVTAWNPTVDRFGINGQINSLAVNDGIVYAGGSFPDIGGERRSCLGALDATTGKATGWNPGASGSVYALAVQGGAVYAGGAFATIGGQTRNRLAAVDAAGNVTAWDPDVPDVAGVVYALTVSDGIVYAGGRFAHAGQEIRNCLAAIDVAGNVIAWDPDVSSANSAVYALAVNSGVVYAGGYFTAVGKDPQTQQPWTRNGLAAIHAYSNDESSGTVTTWNPDANNAVRAMAVSKGTVYVGGYFTDIGYQPRNHLAAIHAYSSDESSGAVTTWNPDANDTVLALAVSDGIVYAGGLFTAIGEDPQTQEQWARNGLAAIDAGTGESTGWDPRLGGWGQVFALAVNDTVLYAGGSFSSVGGKPRASLAAIDLATGVATDWNPDLDSGNVCALEADGDTVTAGGGFESSNGDVRSHFARWNP